MTSHVVTGLNSLTFTPETTAISKVTLGTCLGKKKEKLDKYHNRFALLKVHFLYTMKSIVEFTDVYSMYSFSQSYFLTSFVFLYLSLRTFLKSYFNTVFQQFSNAFITHYVILEHVRYVSVFNSTLLNNQ